jgi:hypothetical protein
MQGKIEANLSAGSQMTIWGQPRTSAELYGSDVGYRRMYRCFFAMDMVGREDGAQPWRASRETDRRHHTEEFGNIGRILCASSRVSNLASATYFWVWPICTIQAPKDLRGYPWPGRWVGEGHGFGHRRSLQATRFMSALQ